METNQVAEQRLPELERQLSEVMRRLSLMDVAVADIRPHLQSWTTLLERHRDSLPPDTPESAEEEACYERSYVEHELRAMRRDLGALLAI